MSRLLISFSGGETSAYMTWALLKERSRSDTLVVFANTGQEREETLEFVRQCDEHFGFATVWVEAVQNFGERKSASFRVVDFTSADRVGEVFENYIKKYGIPNTDYPGCTRDLKLNAIKAYCRSVGWANGSYDTAVGIRADEIDRQSLNAEANRIVYPLIKRGIRKPHINEWWTKQPFRLRLKGYQGNCRWCWKKSFRKHLTLIAETPDAYEFPRRMEALYGRVGPEFAKAATDADHSRKFFRGRRSTDDLFAMHEERGDEFVPADDDALTLPDQPGFFDPDLDQPGGCGESCEVWSDELDEAA
jgi:hypothetical protein